VSITVFVCGGPKPPPCSVPECGEPGKYPCAYPLGGARAGQTCGRLLCALHVQVEPVSRMRVATAQSLALCPPHQRLMRQRDQKGVRE
jgi:hypothetical protein